MAKNIVFVLIVILYLSAAEAAKKVIEKSFLSIRAGFPAFLRVIKGIPKNFQVARKIRIKILIKAFK